LHFFWCWLFIWKLDGREKGAAAATNITWILNMLIADLVIRWKKLQGNADFVHMINFYDLTVFRDIGVYLRIGVPNMLMLCCEWWIFEILTIFSGLLGVTQLAAEVVIVNIITFIFMIPLGISYAASALTGNYLGEGKIDLAKKFASMTVIFDIIITSLIVLLLGIF
jgi:MATE family multidrug resistance protein